MRCLTCVICGFLLASSAPAQGKGKGKGHGRGETQAAVQVSVFGRGDRRIIVDYFQGARSGLPPGLAKHGLSPGLEKQLRRNGRLPPGLEKKLQLFPAELEARLPPLPAGYRRGMIGGRAVLFDPGRSIVLDVFVVW